MALFCPKQRGMVFVCKFIASAFVTSAIYPVLFLASMVMHFARAVVPPGIEQPLKLRIYHILFISIFLWAQVFTGLQPRNVGDSMQNLQHANLGSVSCFGALADMFSILPSSTGAQCVIVKGNILEKLRLCKFLSILRFLTKGLPVFCDSSLFIEEKKFDGVLVKVYQPKTTATTKRKAFIFFHGGAGVYGYVESYERILRYVAKEADSVVVAVEYGLGPENPYPNQYDECFKAAVHFMKHVDNYHVDASRISIGGDSCGANFATRICQLLVERNDLPKVQAQVLIYPGLQGMDFYLPSYQQNSHVPLMWRDTVIYFCCLFLNKPISVINAVLESCHVPENIKLQYRKWVNADLIPEEFKVRGYKPQDPALYKFKPKLYEEMGAILENTFSPLFAKDEIIGKLPQTYILTCEFDVLRDDGLLYKKRLEDNGVPVTWTHIENSIHGIAVLFGLGFLSFPAAQRMVHDFTKFIKSL